MKRLRKDFLFALLRRQLKLHADERFDPCLARQPQAQKAALSHLQMLKLKVGFKSRGLLNDKPGRKEIKIGVLARRTGLSTSAIRYYDRVSFGGPRRAPEC
jgi:hypothetical protein